MDVTLDPPVVNQCDFIGHAQRDKVGGAPDGEDDAEEGEGGRAGFKAALVGLEGKKKKKEKAVSQDFFSFVFCFRLSLCFTLSPLLTLSFFFVP